MEKEQFEQEYAERSGMTVKELRDMGGYAEPCDCDYIYCDGWVMNFEEKSREAL